MDKSIIHKRQGSKETLAELESRLRTYQELDRHTRALHKDLQQKLKDGKIGASIYEKQCAKLFQGQTPEQRFAYYTSQIKHYEDSIRDFKEQETGRTRTTSFFSNKLSLGVIAACILVALIIALPYLANIKGYAVYEKNYAIAQVNAFVPAGSILTLHAGSTTASVLVDTLNMTSIVSVYNHQITNGYYIEELKLDVTELPLENDTIGTIRVTHNNSLITEAPAIITGKVNTQNASEPAPSLFPMPEGNRSPLLPPIVVEAPPDNQTMTIIPSFNASGNASSTNLSAAITGANATTLTASLDKLLYVLGEQVTVRITPESASYSGVLIDPRGKSGVLENLTFYPKRAGDYAINLLIYTNETDRRLSLQFGVITNITQLLGNLTSGNATNVSASLKHNLPSTLVKVVDGFRIQGLERDEDMVLKSDPSERAALHKYKGRGEFLLKKHNEYVGVFDLDIDQDIDLSTMHVEFNRTLKSAAIHFNSTISSLVKRTILAPRGPNDHMVYMCPFARTIAEGDKNCPGYTLFSDRQRIGDMFAQKVEIDGQLYFEIANVTGTDVSTNVTCGVTVFNDIILGANLTQSGGGACIVLGADGIDFNCANNYLNETGTGTNGVGFYAGNKTSIVIGNCTIIGFQVGIGFNGSINHSVIEHNNLSWNKFGIQNSLTGQTFLNSSIRFNIFNSTSDDDIDLMLARDSNITANNFTRGTSLACRTCNNVTIAHNVFFNMTRNGIRCTSACNNMTINGNVFHGAVPAINFSVITRNLVIERNLFNLTSSIAITLRPPAGNSRVNGTIRHNVIGGNGLEIGINIHTLDPGIVFFNNLTVFNNTFNTTKYDVFIGDLSSSGNRVTGEGPIIFHNNTIFSPPRIYIENTSLNITFFNTNFSVPGVIDVVYPRFNLTPLSIILETTAVLNISYFNFWINGTVSDYAIVGVNVSNVSDLNRSANVTIYNINCTAGYRLYYNETLIPFMDTLNQSFVAANQDTASGAACTSPATCQNVRCTGGDGGVLQFDITQFSSFGAQNFGAGVSCGSTITTSTTLTSSISTTSGVCITINASDIFLNCNGNTLSGNGAGTRGIVVGNRTGIRVENCTLRNFATAIELTQGVNHSVISRNTLINNTNGTIIGIESFFTRNITMNFNFINSSTRRDLFAQDIDHFNLSSNNFSTSIPNVDTRIIVPNATIENNQISAPTDILIVIRPTSNARTFVLLRNTFNSSTGGRALNLLGDISNLTIRDMNITGDSAITTCLELGVNDINGSIINMRCENAETGLSIGSQGNSEYFINFTWLFVNVTAEDIIRRQISYNNFSGVLNFLNTTFVTDPEILLANVSINMTFNNTNFTHAGVSLVYPYFNISTSLVDRPDFLLNLSNFIINGSANDFGLIGINATNLTLLNRSADAYMVGVDCSGFRITYNESFVSLIDTLNQSFEVLDQFMPTGGATCAQPSSCSNVRCENSMLTFNITQFSSYSVQNQPGNLTACGPTLRFNTTLTNNLNQSSGDACLTIGADGLTLDCSRMIINETGAGTSGVAIYAMNRSRVTVANCTIIGFQEGIQFNGSVNDSLIQQNNLSWNAVGVSMSSSDHFVNSIIRWNTFNASSNFSVHLGNGTNISVSSNNFTADDIGVRLRAQAHNVTISSNRFVGMVSAALFVFERAENVSMFLNDINDAPVRGIGASSSDRVDIVRNFFNMTGGVGIRTIGSINGTVEHNSIKGMSTGVNIGTSGTTMTVNMTFVNNTMNTTTDDVYVGDMTAGIGISAISSSTIFFVNTTFTNAPSLRFVNITFGTASINFNNTHFNESGIIDVLFPFFNVTLPPPGNTVIINSTTNFFVNGTGSDFGVVAVNATNVSALNRSANVTIPNINCTTGYRLYYNASFVPFIDTLNQSFVAADQNTASGGACNSPATCENVRCTGGNGGSLTFDITQFSSFGAQNFDETLTCGTALTSSRTLTYNLNTTSGACLTFGADNIYLNCNGNTLTGNGTGTRGIAVENRTGIIIENCTLRNFATAIELTRGVNHTIVMRNTVFNSTNSTIVKADEAFSNDFRNITIANNVFNGTATSGSSDIRIDGVATLNVTNNNFTVADGNFENSSNITIQKNRFVGELSTLFFNVINTNVYVRENTFANITGGATAIEITGTTRNLTLLDTNVSVTSTCLNPNGPLNGTIGNFRCEGSTDGIRFGSATLGVSESLFLNLSNIFINVTSLDIAASIVGVDIVPGGINFINLTMVRLPVIEITNISINMTFNNTNFTDGNATLFYSYFNISTDIPTGASLSINRTYLYINGSAIDESGVIALNATNLTLLNRSADAYMLGVDCSAFRLTYNESFIPFIDTLNQSFEVADQTTATGGACSSPSSCSNVRCENSMLTFNITQFSSHGVQNQPGNVTACGAVLLFNTTLTNTLTQSTAGQCLTLNASGIFLNCDGRELIGNGTGTRGIVAGNRTDLRIENCTIRNFATAIELTQGVNHSVVSRNTLINNTNGTILNVIGGVAVYRARNMTMNFNTINGSTDTSDGLNTQLLDNLNLSFNNFTTSRLLIRSPNATIEDNRISNPSGQLLRIGPGSDKGTFVLLRNTINSTGSATNFLIDGPMGNLTVRDMNISGGGIGGICLRIGVEDINGSITNLRCENELEGLIIGVGTPESGEFFINFTGLFFNVSGNDILRQTSFQSNFTGVLSFRNTTFVTLPSITLLNISINITFNNTNFTHAGASLVYPYFNISTSPTDKTSFFLNVSNFVINGTAGGDGFSLIAINATNLTELNRSANASILNINCSAGYRLYYNQSFVPFIDTLNQSFVAANQNTVSGSACTSPATCQNVRCTGGNGGTLTFDITQFSSFGAQNFDAGVSCGSTLTANTTLNANINTTAGTCLTIGANNIFLNCNGSIISGNGTGTRGIVMANRTGLRIENCTIRDFATGIELTQNVTHIILNRNTLVNNTNGTIIKAKDAIVDSFTNITLTFTHTNLSTTRGLRAIGVDALNISTNNFTRASVLFNANNVVMERNQLNGTFSEDGLIISATSRNVQLLRNTFGVLAEGITANGNLDNVTITDTNVTGSSTCFSFDAPMNGTVSNLRCEGVTTGLQISFVAGAATGFFSVNFTRLFVNASTAEIIGTSTPQANATGVIDFVNSTFVTTPAIFIVNISINMTFNNTNFTDNSVSLFFPYFNISTNPTTKTSFVLNRSTFFVNGSETERYGFVAINTTNITDMNRSANVSMLGIDCSKFRIFFNQTFYSAISPLRNSSFTVARNTLASGGECLSPALCGNVRCLGTTATILVFNITGFSSFGAQNNTPPSQVTLVNPTNGNISVFERRPPFDWTDATDVDGDNITYNITGVHGFCTAFADASVNRSNFTTTFNLCTNGDNADPFNWTVQPSDGTDTGNLSERFNFTIDAFITINLTTNTTNFGSKNVTNEDNTTDNVPPPFIAQNDGNVLITIRINASASLWLTQALNTRFFQFRIDNTSAEPNPGAFNVTTSVLNFTNMTNTNVTAIKQLNFSDASDTAEIDFLIRVPSDEPAGSKSSIITVIGEFDE